MAKLGIFDPIPGRGWGFVLVSWILSAGQSLKAGFFSL